MKYGTPHSTSPAAGSAADFAVPFTVANGNIVDPAGNKFTPLGANINGPDFLWNDGTLGHAAAAMQTWGWTCIRLSTSLRDYESTQGYVYFNNNQLDKLVAEYTAQKIVVMIAQHSHLGGGAGLDLPTEPNSAGDPTTRSVEQAVTDWWVEVAKRYRDNPYVWFNLVNEPGPNLADLDAQYRRMVARIRSVAPRSTIVLDAAAFANDIPTSTTIGTGPVSEPDSFVLSKGPALAQDFGPGRGYGPIVFSVHLYARWAVNWGPGGKLTDAQLAARIRDYATRVAAKGIPLIIGEIGVEAYAAEYDSACVRVGLYEQGSIVIDGVSSATGVLVEQDVGVLAWHGARASGMTVSLPSMNWWSATTRSDTNQLPNAGAGLWDYGHLGA